LEASTDLRSWTSLLVRSSEGGRFTFQDGEVSSRGARFYRVVVP